MKNDLNKDVMKVFDVRNSVNNKNKYHNLVIKTFLDDYQKTIELKIPKGYAFRDPTTNELIKPFLMQRYVAYKVKSQPSFGNFSGTGAGKTLSAIIGSRVIDSKFTLIVCPNDVVKHWVNNIREVFPDSKIISGKDVFDAKYDGDVHQYCVLNYDKLNQEDFFSIGKRLTPKEKEEFWLMGNKAFVFDPIPSRIYPQKNLFSHILGQTDDINKGISGIENFFNEDLKNKEKIDQPLNLTLDSNLQHLIRKELIQAQSDFNYIGSAALLMNVKNHFFLNK